MKKLLSLLAILLVAGFASRLIKRNGIINDVSFIDAQTLPEAQENIDTKLSVTDLAIVGDATSLFADRFIGKIEIAGKLLPPVSANQFTHNGKDYVVLFDDEIAGLFKDYFELRTSQRGKITADNRKGGISLEDFIKYMQSRLRKNSNEAYFSIVIAPHESLKKGIWVDSAVQERIRKGKLGIENTAEIFKELESGSTLIIPIKELNKAALEMMRQNAEKSFETMNKLMQELKIKNRAEIQTSPAKQWVEAYEKSRTLQKSAGFASSITSRGLM